MTFLEFNLPLGLKILRELPIPRKLGLLERLYGRKLAKAGVCWVNTAEGPVWKLDLSDSCDRWVVFGDYEGSVQMNWIRKWLKPGGLVVDSGTYYGQMLLYFANLPNIQVLGFEPQPEAREWVKICLDRNKFRNVQIEPVALAAMTGTARLRMDGPRSTIRDDWYPDSKLDEIEVDVKRLDNVLDQRGLKKVRLWKLDVEGFELSALEGARQSLTSSIIDCVLFETNAERVAGFHQFFDSVAYEIFQITRKGLKPLVFLKSNWFGNLVAIPRQNPPTNLLQNG